MITVVCPACTTHHQCQPDQVGEVMACTNCRTLFRITDSSSAHASNSEPTAENDAHWHEYKYKSAIGGGVLLAACVLGYALMHVVRSFSWEAQHKAPILKAKNIADNCKVNNKSLALKKYKEIIDLVGEKKVSDYDIRHALNSAQKNIPKLEQELSDERVEKEAREILVKARALEIRGQAIEAHAEYRAFLARVKNKNVDDPVAKRLLQDARANMNRLHMRHKAEFEKRLAEEKRRKEELKKRAEERRKDELRRQEEERRKKREERLAEERRKAEKRKQQALRIKYRTAPTSARKTLNVLKKLQAKLEIKIEKSRYEEELGKAWGEVKVFTESSNGKKYSELSDIFKSVISHYKAAQKAWDRNISGDVTAEMDLQSAWAEAGKGIEKANKLLNP